MFTRRRRRRLSARAAAIGELRRSLEQSNELLRLTHLELQQIRRSFASNYQRGLGQ